MSYSLQNASKLFVKIPKRKPTFQSAVGSLFHSSSWKNYSYAQDLDGISMEDENVVLWTSKISNFVRKNKPLNAIGLFKEILVKNQKPNFVTLLSIVRAIGQMESGNMVSMIHGYAIKTGFDSEVSVVTALLGVYSVWNISAMGLLFDQTPTKDVVLWSSMVSVCVKNEEYVKAFKFFRKMQFSGVEPNYVTIVSVLPACADLGALQLGKEIHGFSIKKAFYSQINVQNSLVDMYSKCRNFRYSSWIFSRMQLKDQISWRSMIYGCIENDFPGKALAMFSEMRLCGLEPDENIVRDIVVVSSQFGQLDLGLCLQTLALKKGHLAVVSTVTAFLQMYARFNQLGSARILFDSLEYKDLIAWSAMISAYTQNGQSSNAFNIFREMQLTDEKPNEVTFVSLLQSCSPMASSEIGESIHAHVIKAGYISNPFLTSALIDMYCKFGRIRQGESLFEENHANDLICWSSMINGYGINGFGHEALTCFSDMILSGIKPNNVVFISVLSACSHCGGLEYEGWNWFYAMEEKYGLKPKLAHYACMVDMLSRKGNVEEAFEFVKNMPIEPDKRIWGTLVSGCTKTHGCSEILEFVAKQLICLDPKDSSYYVILSNLYAEQGRWIEVEKLREFTDAKGFKKERGYSIMIQ